MTRIKIQTLWFKNPIAVKFGLSLNSVIKLEASWKFDVEFSQILELISGLQASYLIYSIQNLLLSFNVSHLIIRYVKLTS